MTRAARFEVCHGDDGWWARYRAANGRIVWVTETYERRRAAIRAVELICEAPVTTSPFADWPEVEFGPRDTVLEVRDVDERYVPPPVTLRPPFYRVETRPLRREGARLVQGDPETFWHDSEYHYRMCTGTVEHGGDCTEDAPPVGAAVRSRMGTATYSGADS